MNSPPLSLLICKIKKSFSSSSLFLNTWKCEKARSLCSKKKTQVKWEKLSTKIKTKRFSLRPLVLIGPNKSIWINSKGLDVISLIVLKEDFVCFPSWHASHIWSFSNFKQGIPFTTSLLLILDRQTNLYVLSGFRGNNVYMIDMSNLHYNATCLNAFNEDSWLWHRRLGHVSFDHLSRINSKESVKVFLTWSLKKTAFVMRANLRNKPSPLSN